MINYRLSHLTFAELPAEARSLSFAYAYAAVAGSGAQRPEKSYLFPALEIVWNWIFSSGHRTTVACPYHACTRKTSDTPRGAPFDVKV